MKIARQLQSIRSNAVAVLAATCLWALLAAPAQGAMIMSINPSNTNAAANSIGNFFDVILTNTTAATPGIAGFSFGLTAGSANLVFTGAATAPANYIFSGNSFDTDFNVGDIRTSANGQTVLASDLTSNGLDMVFPANASKSIGRVFFSILAGSPAGPIAVSFNIGAGSLSDSAGRAVTLGTPQNATVTVSGVPEPSTASLFLLALPALAFLRKRQ